MAEIEIKPGDIVTLMQDNGIPLTILAAREGLTVKANEVSTVLVFNRLTSYSSFVSGEEKERNMIDQDRLDAQKTAKNLLAQLSRAHDQLANFVARPMASDLVQLAEQPGVLKHVADSLETLLSVVLRDSQDGLDAVQTALDNGRASEKTKKDKP